MSYPCKDCIVKVMCHKSCDKLTSNEVKNHSIINNMVCPDCGGEYANIRKLLTNFYVIYCTECNSKFTINKYVTVIEITRSTIVKGTIFLDAKYHTNNFYKFKSILISDFINYLIEDKIL
jgi:hypothetical protein